MDTNDDATLESDVERATIDRLRGQLDLYRRLYRVALELLKADRRRVAGSDPASAGSIGSGG